MKDLVPEITSFIIFIHSDLCLSLKNKRYPSFAMMMTELNHFTTAILKILTRQFLLHSKLLSIKIFFFFLTAIQRRYEQTGLLCPLQATSSSGTNMFEKVVL